MEDLLDTPVLLLAAGFLLGVVAAWLVWRPGRGVTSAGTTGVWEEQLALVEQEAEGLRRDVRQREQRLTVLQGTVDTLRAQAADEVDRAHVAELEQHLADTEVRVIELTSALRSAADERDELRRTRGNQDLRVASLRRQVERLEDRLAEHDRVDVDDTEDVTGPEPAATVAVDTIALFAIGAEADDEAVIDLRVQAPGQLAAVGGRDDDVGPGEQAPDDLTRIEGIGPSISSALEAAGYATFRVVADARDDELRGVIRRAGLRFAPSLGTWSEQAELLASGDEAGFTRLVDELVGGRRA